MTAALLVASAVNLAFLLTERSRFGLIESSAPAITRFADLVDVMIDRPIMSAPALPRFDPAGPPGAPGGRMGRFSVADISMVDQRGLRENAKLSKRLSEALDALDHTGLQVKAAAHVIDRPPLRMGGRARNDARFDPDGAWRNRLPPRVREIVLSAQLPGGSWVGASMLAPLPNGDDAWRLAASTIVAFACVLAAALWIASRVARPLRTLASAATRVGGASPPEEVPVQGPSDIREAIQAFNAMNQRVSHLLTEKDLMLGALGHDLRTPLTSLRIRLETMEPEIERQKAIRTIEDASLQLESILDLARLGRSQEPPRLTDLSALVQDMVEDYADTGANVTFDGPGKAALSCHAPQIQRALRNLIDNALKYAGSAHVALGRTADGVEIVVQDDGPGLPAEDLEAVKSPFARGEGSRNRATGGAGLGLALAEAVAKAHGGALRLQNRTPKGLAVSLLLPTAPKPAAP
jgi:signal transduction histidine kinase